MVSPTEPAEISGVEPPTKGVPLTKKYFEAAGMEVALFEGVTPGAVDYSAVVQKIKKNKVDLVTWGGYHPEASKIVTLMHKKKVKTPFMGPDGINVETPLGKIKFDDKGDAIGVGFSMYRVQMAFKEIQ